MTLKDDVGTEINFITRDDAVETWSGGENLFSIVKNDNYSVAYCKIEPISFKTLAQEKFSLTYSAK